MDKRLFIVSSRLPITIDEENGVQPASGGLVTAINGYVRNSNQQQFSTVYWAGVPGCSKNTWSENAENII
ncbi:hypothetical protein, partial [Niastella populi]|uniref:hypothetical protein n=1 Tax=Niastella populi TaxID=550983 RepID=UPI001A99744F